MPSSMRPVRTARNEMSPRKSGPGDDTMATLRIQIGPADHGRRMTLDEFREAEGQPGYLYELARGVLEVIEIPKTPHRRIVSNLYSLVAHYKREHAGVIDYFGGGMEVRV